MDPIKEFHKTVLSLDNCIIPNERLINTPSSRDGMSHDLEVDLRIVGCEYIQSAGLLLRLPQVSGRKSFEDKQTTKLVFYMCVHENIHTEVSDTVEQTYA